MLAIRVILKCPKASFQATQGLVNHFKAIFSGHSGSKGYWRHQQAYLYLLQLSSVESTASLVRLPFRNIFIFMWLDVTNVSADEDCCNVTYGCFGGTPFCEVNCSSLLLSTSHIGTSHWELHFFFLKLVHKLKISFNCATSMWFPFIYNISFLVFWSLCRTHFHIGIQCWRYCCTVWKLERTELLNC